MKFKTKLVYIFILFTITEIQGQEIGLIEPDSVIIKQGNKYSILDNTGKIKLNDVDSIKQDKKTGAYIVNKMGLYGMFSKLGTQIIPVEFERIEHFYNQYWLVQTNQKKGIYNVSTGKNLPATFDDIILTYKINAELIVKKDNKYGVLDCNWNTIVPLIYDNIKNNNGIIELLLENQISYLIADRIIKHKIIPYKTFLVYGLYPDDAKTYYVYEEQKKLGIINNVGLPVLTAKYDDIIPQIPVEKNALSANVFFVKLADKWGMINLLDTILVPLKYESIMFATSDYLIVGTNGFKQFYSLKNKKILGNITFEKYFNFRKYSRIEKNGLETLLDNNTMRLIFPYKYESILYNENTEMFTVNFHNKYGIINLKGKQVIPLIYDEPIIITCNNKIVAKKDGKYGVIDINNKVLLPFATRYIIGYANSFEIQKEGLTETETFDCELNKIEKK
jgi:hypothetical protein